MADRIPVEAIDTRDVQQALEQLKRAQAQMQDILLRGGYPPQTGS